MIGAIAGAALAAAGSIWGNSKRAKAARKQRQELERQERRNKAWYDRRYNEDATQRADTLRVLNRAEQILKDRNRYAQGAQAVSGGTEEGVAVQKQAATQALADAVGQISAASEQRKDAIEQQYLARQDQIDAQKAGMEAAKDANTAQAIQGLGGVVSNLAQVDWGKKATPELEPKTTVQQDETEIDWGQKKR